MGSTMRSGPFEENALALHEQGWPVIPWAYVDGAKRPSVRGHHGRDHLAADTNQVRQWVRSYGTHNVGIVLPDGIIAFDVDNHDRDGVIIDGQLAIKELERRAGTCFPPTWRIAHSGADSEPPPQGHMIYRLPAELIGEFVRGRVVGNLDGTGYGGVDMVLPWLRYLAAPGSIHKSEEAYRWVSPDSPQSYTTQVPSTDEIPELPSNLARQLLRPDASPRQRRDTAKRPKMPNRAQTLGWLEQFRDDARSPEDWSPRVNEQATKWESARHRNGARHDTARDVALALTGLARGRSAGAVWALESLGEDFTAAVSSDRDGNGEFADLLTGAVAIVDASEPLPIGEFTDAALAERIATELADAGTPVAWNAGLGWLIWNGKRWAVSDIAAVTELVRQHVRTWFVTEARSGADEGRYNALRGLQSRARIAAIVDLIDGHVERPIEAFDTNSDLLNVQNGVVDLRTGELMAHDPALGCTRIAKVAYSPKLRGHSKAWKQAKEALPLPVRDYIMARLGQAVTGHTPEDDRAVVLVGGGANGKTTFLTPILDSLGDYAGTVRQELLLASNSQHPEIFMDLRGRRLVWMDETAEGTMNPQRLKRVVGTTVITARHLYRSSVQFRPTHSLFISTNHPPNVRDTDRGTWRRLLQVVFPYVFGGEPETYGELARPVDLSLRQRLTDSRVLEAVLAELVSEAVRWHQRGQRLPAPPDAVVAATEAWRKESDLLLQFVEENLEAEDSGHIPLSDLIDTFNEWLKAHGHSTIGHDTLHKRLRAHERLPGDIPYKVARKRPQALGASRRGSNFPSSSNPVSSWVGVRYRGR